MAKKKQAAALAAAAILAADDIKIERVAVPEWDGYVHVRTIAASVRDQWEVLVAQEDKDVNRDLSASFLVLCICDAEGTLLFKPGDAAKLGAKSSAALKRLWRVARRLNGIGDDELEELEKN